MKGTSFTTGLIAGAVIGAAIGIAMDPARDKNNGAFRSQANGMFKTLGGVIDSVVNMKDWRFTS